MKTAICCAVFLLLGTAVLGEICFEPVSESQVILTLSVLDVYAAWDYTQGKVFFTAVNNASEDDFTLIDLNNNVTYISSNESCVAIPGYAEVFAQCLPDDAYFLHTIDEHDLYYIHREGALSWLVGITKDEGTGYYQRFISRYTAYGSVLDVGVTYWSSLDVTDMSVFDRNTSSCVWSY
ncbi:hypothetical protein EGW08_018892 [Elysia chlorotica]|uniref:Bee-milk protein n=1 Tax=Elysia chlorotica TaxID=188477 RepID=A0A3S1H6Q5_ELYCH|nr:hypothetical protein EGW08_018892 [Elysia chlorotica]